MKYLPKNYCKGCRVHCSKHGAFTLHRYRKDEEIAFPNNKNYMIFMLSGALQVRSEEIGVFDCSQGQVIILAENGIYDVFATAKCEILVLVFNRSFKLCEKVDGQEKKRINGYYRYTFHSLPINEPLDMLIKSIVRYIRDDTDCCVYIHEAKQAELFIVCKMYYDETELMKFFVPILNNQMHFESLVKVNQPNAKSVEDLATLCGYGVHSFKKIFRAHFNLSPYKWMLQQNQRKILNLLLDNTVPIKVIAAEFGFSSQSHFNRYCNRYFGGPSSQIRAGKTQQ